MNDHLLNGLAGYSRTTGNHYTASILWDFLKKTSFIISNVCKTSPTPGVPTYYIDSSSTEKGGIHGPGITSQFKASIHQHNKQKYSFLLLY